MILKDLWQDCALRRNRMIGVVKAQIESFHHTNPRNAGVGGRSKPRKSKSPQGSLGMSNPFTWTQKVLKPALEKIGLTTIDKQREVMAKLFPNRNVNRMFDIFLDPMSVQRIYKDRALYGQGASLDKAYGDYTSNNPKGVEAAFHAQWESMLELGLGSVTPCRLRRASRATR
jgi:hypothetical protein